MPTTATHTLYCDETGSTGSRFLDPEQPVYGEGGWFVAKSKAAKVAEAVEKVEKKFRTGMCELKGAKLAKTRQGQSVIREVCEAVGRSGGVPFLYLVEKRYAVCTKIVETFFDPNYNPTIHPAETWNPERRQSDAKFFYANGGALIDEFAEAYRTTDPAAAKANAEKWVEHLAKTGMSEQAVRIAGVIPNIEDEIATEKKHGQSGFFPSGMDSLNMPILVDVFQFVEQHCPYTCDILHDGTASFEPVYKYCFDIFKKAKPATVEKIDGTQIRFGLQKANSLSFADSRTEPIIRAADYALAGTRNFIHLALAEKAIPQDITRTAFGMIGALLVGIYCHVYPSLGQMPELNRVMSSTDWIHRILNRLAEEMKAMQS